MIATIILFIVLGFLLAWIAQMVAREEVTVTTGVITLVASGVVTILIQIGLASVIGNATRFTSFPVTFGVLLCALHVIPKLSWRHSAIIAAIYAAVMFLLGLALSSCSSQ